MVKTTPMSLFSLAFIATFLACACSPISDQSGQEESSGSSGSSDEVTKIWADRTLHSYIIQEIFDRGDSRLVVKDIESYYEERREVEEASGIDHFDGINILLESGALVEIGEDYRISDDSEEWDTGVVSGIRESEVDQAMVHILEATEVSWCGDSVKGYEFADSYMNTYWGCFDTESEYVASIENYVGCGSGG